MCKQDIYVTVTTKMFLQFQLLEAKDYKLKFICFVEKHVYASIIGHIFYNLFIAAPKSST